MKFVGDCGGYKEDMEDGLRRLVGVDTGFRVLHIQDKAGLHVFIGDWKFDAPYGMSADEVYEKYLEAS